ncbi:MAG: 2,3-bisphosphoglycerate-independent phosphoglycerate mutase [Christensenellaceae bacterium]|jgi:2,3-bisphosphoglycerate-independent phosphoglycerate mutase|nr:2,3-bisphosphoglycerate-independent phosphoglycerate mutase [Christensenellaceae bacterium]
MNKKLTALIIMDGFGLRAEREGNAILQQGTPALDSLAAEFPHTEIGASGMDVGLPDGQMGNSEVGHLNIGAGRIVYQELTRISKSIADGDFFKNEVLLEAISSAKQKGGKLHLMGLLSDGGVHSHNTHLYALIALAKRQGLSSAYVHCIMDGRDTPPTSGADYVAQLEAEMKRQGFGAIASVSGRYYAMDRDKRWDRVQKAYETIACGLGQRAESGAEQLMLDSYAAGVNDEFIVPTALVKDGAPIATVEEGDSVIFFNFRPDRTRELTQAFIDADFSGFPREGGRKPVFFVGMTRYDDSFQNIETAFKPSTLDNTLGEYLSSLNLSQLRIAETEKYAHVTFFFNGGVEKPNKGEDRTLIPSPKVATYDLKPEMSAYEVTDAVLEAVDSGKYDVMILNYANCDMVGHTGILTAAKSAVRVVDECVGRVVEAILKQGGRALITADHGNADLMVDPETGEAFTAHTTSKVPLILADEGQRGKKLRAGGRLADLAPTILKLMGLPKPSSMSGESLL